MPHYRVSTRSRLVVAVALLVGLTWPARALSAGGGTKSDPTPEGRYRLRVVLRPADSPAFDFDLPLSHGEYRSISTAPWPACRAYVRRARASLATGLGRMKCGVFDCDLGLGPYRARKARLTGIYLIDTALGKTTAVAPQRSRNAGPGRPASNKASKSPGQSK